MSKITPRELTQGVPRPRFRDMMALEGFVLTLRRLVSLSLPLLLTLSCVPENEQVADNALLQTDCGAHDRIDAQVRRQAVEDFRNLGKPCDQDQLQIFPQNERETLWKACCGPAAINFIYYLQKCVVHRSGGLVQCTR